VSRVDGRHAKLAPFVRGRANLRDMTEARRGFLLGFAASGFWGLLPLYWALLDNTGAPEVISHRVVWSLVAMLMLACILRRFGDLRTVISSARNVAALGVSSVVIAVNWGFYVWGVNNGYVVEASLGYFISPIVTVVLGVLFANEHLRPMQWLSLAVAAASMLVLALEFGRPPWVALILALTFGSYGIVKRQADAGPIESLIVEMAVLSPLAIGYIIWLMATGSATVGEYGAVHGTLIAGTGLITAIPLLCFSAAVTRISMTTLGLLQYVAPTVQFGLGVFLFREPMPAIRLFGFILVWIALISFTVEMINHRHRQLKLAADATSI
jgi:chloramphenicol-sensitive protein RarD